jgi:hypothetical protein
VLLLPIAVATVIVACVVQASSVANIVADPREERAAGLEARVILTATVATVPLAGLVITGE